MLLRRVHRRIRLNSLQVRYGCSFVRVSTISLVLLACSVAALSDQIGSTIRFPDNSDWWSDYNAPESEATTNTQAREVSSSNFEVLGIHLSEDMFTQAAAKLGPATIIERGDASTGRGQACYVSTEDGPKVHLIFEQGEVDYTYYLFADGPDWQGSEHCVSTSLVSRSLATASGVRLGETPAQVIAILGRPSFRGNNELLYSLDVRKKRTPEELKRLREGNPGLDEADSHNYDSYDSGANFIARFVHSKLTYFTASASDVD
jgi:hypothetical protein